MQTTFAESPLAGKRVLVTGGGTGIGRACALALAHVDCRTMIAGRRRDVLQETMHLAGETSEIYAHPADVSDRSEVERLVRETVTRLGGLDIVIHAAGINIKNRSMAEMRPEQWDQVMAVNATGTYNVFYYTLPELRQQPDGLIVNVTSIAGKRAIDLGGVAYCASKFAATALGTAVGQEEAAHGVRVTNVYPGEVDTPLLEQRPKPVSAERRARMLRPQHVAQMILSICRLPPPAHVPEIVIKPLEQVYF